MAWTKSSNQDVISDKRGWKKHRLRSYTHQDEQRILAIHKLLDNNPHVYFSGASAILQRYQQEYPRGKELTLRFIGRMLAKHGPVSYTHLRAHETRHDLVCRLLLEK